MSDQARLFEGSGPLLTFAPGGTKRTEADHRAQLHRIGTMHNRHGHGAEGQTCKGCAHLIPKGVGRYTSNDGKRFLKCELYNAGGYEGTDWRAKWPACGAFKREGLTPAGTTDASSTPPRGSGPRP
jgi:hypothetical protein